MVIFFSAPVRKIIEIKFEVLPSENQKKKSAKKPILKEKENIDSTENNKEASNPNTQTTEDGIKMDKKRSIDEVAAETNQKDKPTEEN